MALSLCHPQVLDVGWCWGLLGGCLDPNFCGVNYSPGLSPSQTFSFVVQYDVSLKKVPEHSGTFSV